MTASAAKSNNRQIKSARPIATATGDAQSNSELAFKFWLQRRFHEGSPEEDLLRAVCANTINLVTVRPALPSQARPSKAKRK
jgi:hypothetical protein